MDRVLQQVVAYLQGEDVPDVDMSGFDDNREWVAGRTFTEEQVTDLVVTYAVDDRSRSGRSTRPTGNSASRC